LADGKHVGHTNQFLLLNFLYNFAQELGGDLQILSVLTNAQTSSCPFFRQIFGLECLQPIVLSNVSPFSGGRFGSWIGLLITNL